MDWLTNTQLHLTETSWVIIGVRMCAAFVLGWLIARIYRWTHRHNDAPEDSFLTTLVMLTVIIAMSTQVIGDHIARAFSLVGALSIVRFRTAVQDTRDIAFVIFAVVVGMAAGVGNFAVALLGVLFTALAAWWMRPTAHQVSTDFMRSSLKVSLGHKHDANDTLGNLFAKYFASHTLRSKLTNPLTEADELTYQVRFYQDRSPAEFLAEARECDGVRNIKLSALNR